MALVTVFETHDDIRRARTITSTTHGIALCLQEDVSRSNKSKA